MGRSQESFGKKEVRNKKAKKRKEKAERRLAKKEQGKTSLDDMIAYVDENGNITDTPPDLSQKTEVDVESIEIGVQKKEKREGDLVNTGKVTAYNDSKGYGFVVDDVTGESYFAHINDCDGELGNGVKVEFKTEKGPRGLKAIEIKVIE